MDFPFVFFNSRLSLCLIKNHTDQKIQNELWDTLKNNDILIECNFDFQSTLFTFTYTSTILFCVYFFNSRLLVKE